MLVNEVLNQGLANLNFSLCDADTWILEHDVHQKLTVSITAQPRPVPPAGEGPITSETFPGTPRGEIGRVVGLTQTLYSSERIATYEGGGQFIIIPTVGLPCLDGNPDRVPWYDIAAAGEALPRGSVAITKTVDDAPGHRIPAWAVDPSGGRKKIKSLKAKEEFIVSVYDEGEFEILRQWRWGYDFLLEADANGHPVVVSENTGPAVEQIGAAVYQGIIITGPSAEEGQVKAWTGGLTHTDSTWL